MNQSIISKHSKWMSEALAVAKHALPLNEVPVGCILLTKDDLIIGKGNYAVLILIQI